MFHKWRCFKIFRNHVLASVSQVDGYSQLNLSYVVVQQTVKLFPLNKTHIFWSGHDNQVCRCCSQYLYQYWKELLLECGFYVWKVTIQWCLICQEINYCSNGTIRKWKDQVRFISVLRNIKNETYQLCNQMITSSWHIGMKNYVNGLFIITSSIDLLTRYPMDYLYVIFCYINFYYIKFNQQLNFKLNKI